MISILRGRCIPVQPGALVMLLTASVSLFGQQHVDIDWVNAKPTSPPITVDKATPVTVTIHNVNDFLYSYHVRVVATERDPVQIQPAFLGPFSATLQANDPCKELADALDELDKTFATPELRPDIKSKTLPKSEPLDTTQSAYKLARPQIVDLSSHVKGCNSGNDAKGALKRMADYFALQEDWDKIAQNQSHDFVFQLVLQPLNDYSIYILEQYKGTTTDHCTNKDNSGNTVGVECLITYQPTSTLITASGGFLMTQLTSPTYDRSNVPNSSQAVLTVSNNGPLRAGLTGLINISIPHCQNPTESIGCAFSVGPAFSFTGNSATTNIGLFAGISLHLWHYLYLTPGFHLGQYPGFPAGFTQAGQPIPSSFTGKLDPINRSSVRFAFGITFKGWDVTKKNATSQGTPTNGKALTK